MKRIAKSILAEQGIKVFQKDIKNVAVHPMTVIRHEVGKDLEPDHFSHRDIILVEMNDGTRYEILRETVDNDGNFSINSARFVTREVRKTEG